MHLAVRATLLASITAALTISTFACSDSDDRWSHLFQGVTISSTPSIVGPDGNPISTTWSGNATSNQDGFGITLNAKNGMRLMLDFANPQPPMTFTTFALRETSDIFAKDVPQGVMRIAFVDPADNEATSASGTVRLEQLDAPASDTLESGRFSLKVTFDQLVLKTGSASSTTSTKARPLAGDGGFVQDDTGGYAFTGSLGASGYDAAYQSSSSSSSSGGGSSSGSSGGTKDCSKAWTCANDGQATPFCQAACNYEGTQRQQTCAVLKSMLSESGASCCSKYCP